MKPRKPLLIIDGCTGEGGGQLVRLACALAALTSQPIRITNVRGNRGRSTGLKSQHVSAIRWLAEITAAEVKGLAVGSRTLEFRPAAPPSAALLGGRKVVIEADSPGASALLIFQAVFPFLLFAGNSSNNNKNDDDDDGNGGLVELEIRGSTNPSFSPSYEYLDQVFLPTLQERFGVAVERRLERRAWTAGPSGQGAIWLRFRPVAPGRTLKLVKPWSDESRLPGDVSELVRIDVSILVPHALRAPTENALAEYLGAEFPAADVGVVLSDDSGHEARMYVLAVAHSASGLRWGRDFLYDRSRKKKQPAMIAREMAREVTRRLREQVVARAAAVDDHLQDQLVVFQALAEGGTTYWRRPAEGSDAGSPEGGGVGVEDGDARVAAAMRRDRTHQPFGFGSTHATTARWIASQLLPAARWFNEGTVCEGAGFSV